MSNTTLQNEPFLSKENNHSDHLDHITHGHGKWISSKYLENLAVNAYRTNGKGLTYSYLINKLHISKKKAQRKLKNAKKSGLLFTLDNRTKPQQYFPSCIQAEIKKNKNDLEKSRLIATTGVRLSHNTDLENIQIRNITELLTIFQNKPLSIHKIHLKAYYNKIYYDDIAVDRFDKKDRRKIHEQRIGVRNINYQIYPNGTIMVYINCSNSPFKLEFEEDVSSFFSFLGQVKEILRELINDTSEQIIPPIMKWILVQCDVNADIPINIVEELSIPNLQLKVLDKVFRLYVKHIDGKAFYRIEESKQINKPVGIGISQIMNTSNSLSNDPYDPIKFHYIQ